MRISNFITTLQNHMAEYGDNDIMLSDNNNWFIVAGVISTEKRHIVSIFRGETNRQDSEEVQRKSKENCEVFRSIRKNDSP